MRLFIVANSEKPRVRPALEEMLPWLRQRVDVVGVDGHCDSDMSKLDADAVLVLGGDGTLLSAARRLHGRKIPLLGVNFGRLGFLAGFTPAQFREHFETFVQGKLPVRPRDVLEASVLPPGAYYKPSDHAAVASQRRFVSTALNDMVITAGPPFHMVELHIGVDGEGGAKYFGDGVIVATASGSTAYNVSAGGPILSPSVDAFCITPICPHSLSLRPVVISSNCTVVIDAKKVNHGTTLFCDGQTPTPIRAGEKIVLSKSPDPVFLLENPDNRELRTLAEKLSWGVGPIYQNDGDDSSDPTRDLTQNDDG